MDQFNFEDIKVLFPQRTKQVRQRKPKVDLNRGEVRRRIEDIHEQQQFDKEWEF